MSGPIKQGDMVMLVWACCASARSYIGWVGEIEAISSSGSICGGCGHTSIAVHATITIDHTGTLPLSWFIKIEPPQTTEQQHSIEELTV